MRNAIAAMQVSVDGFIEGPNGEMDWVMEEDEEGWGECFSMLEHVDACVLGRKMYPGYEQYWMAVLAKPTGNLPLSGRPATKNEVAYARWADKTPHYVVSTTLEKTAWKTTRIVRDLEEVRRMKQQPGKDMYVVGGATLVASLLNAGLIDELKLTISPLILGGGKALLKDVKDRHRLRLLRSRALKSGGVVLTYGVEGE